MKPVLGQDTSRLLGGALVRPEHGHLGALDKEVGVDVDADWNRVIPSDRPTRAYLVALWDDPTPQIARIEATARTHLVVWSAPVSLWGSWRVSQRLGLGNDRGG